MLMLFTLSRPRFDSFQEPSPAPTEKRFHGDGVDEFGHHASMFKQSTLSPLIFISSDVSEEELADSSLAINGMTILRHAEQSDGIPLTRSLGAFHRKCVEWAAHEFRWPSLASWKILLKIRPVSQ
ncbi:hypothetical protein [Rhizobium lentis]|uniref:Uncharacterized protein n=1 Tax=Rhizobium lentis TaxID=1138194 RepID=A0ABS7I955_9HYPH|nr:hypothetical protein [Rhizobium lentis]MBX5088374.1 hypothetical protein [Rhizobium lentis]